MSRFCALPALKCVSQWVLLVGLGLGLLPLGCGVGVSGTAGSAAAREQAAVSTGVLPASFFGMVVRNPAVQPVVTTGARRLWDSGVTWAALEPARGSYDWAVLDGEVETAQEAGAQVTLTLAMTPTWASSQPALPSAYGSGATAMPASLADWDSFVAAVVSRYRGRIGAYEVWNAPEDPAYWSGAATRLGADLATLATHAAVAVHGGDPAAVVVSPALSPTGLSAFLRSQGGTAVDAVGGSLVGPGQAPESIAANLQALRAAMVGSPADGKPLWNDQGAWALPQGGLDAGMQAAYVARALVLNAGLAVRRMQWYAWDGADASAVALTDAATQPTEAALAYGVVESWLAGAAMNGCAATASGVWTCQLVRGGQVQWIVWSANGAVSSSALGAGVVVDLQGNVTPVDGSGSVVLGAAPVLLR